METKLVRTYRDEYNVLRHVYEDVEVTEREEPVSEQEEMEYKNSLQAYLDRTAGRKVTIKEIEEEQEEDDNEHSHLVHLFDFEDEEESLEDE